MIVCGPGLLDEESWLTKCQWHISIWLLIIRSHFNLSYFIPTLFTDIFCTGLVEASWVLEWELWKLVQSPPSTPFLSDHTFLRAVLLLIFLRIYILAHFILLSSWFNFKLTYIGISTYSCTQLRTRQVYTKMCYITDKYTWCFNASIKYEGKFSNWKLLVYHGVDEA